MENSVKTEKVVYKKTVKSIARDSNGKFVSKNKKIVKKLEKESNADELPPLVDLEVTNPVKYLKIWWKKVMSGEGVDFRFRIKPLTAVALAMVFVLGGAGAGWVSNSVLRQVPVVREFVPVPTSTPMPTPTPNPWVETAFTGTLKQVGSGGFYLVTNEAEAITLSIPVNVNLTKYIGKRILAIGSFNKQTGVLEVKEATDMEVLIQSTLIPTIVITVTPKLEIEPSL